MDNQYEQSVMSDCVTMAQYGNTIPSNVAQLAPQFRILPSNEAVSSIQRPIKWSPPNVPNVAKSYPSSMVFGQEQRMGDRVLWHEFVNARFGSY
jgi:hypothetical protein